MNLYSIPDYEDKHRKLVIVERDRDMLTLVEGWRRLRVCIAETKKRGLSYIFRGRSHDVVASEILTSETRWREFFLKAAMLLLEALSVQKVISRKQLKKRKFFMLSFHENLTVKKTPRVRIPVVFCDNGREFPSVVNKSLLRNNQLVRCVLSETDMRSVCGSREVAERLLLQQLIKMSLVYERIKRRHPVVRESLFEKIKFAISRSQVEYSRLADSGYFRPKLFSVVSNSRRVADQRRPNTAPSLLLSQSDCILLASFHEKVGSPFFGSISSNDWKIH